MITPMDKGGLSVMEKIHGLFIAGMVVLVVHALYFPFSDPLLESARDFTQFLQQSSNVVTNWVFLVVDKLIMWVAVLIPLYCLSAEGLKTGLPLMGAACIAVGLANVLQLTYIGGRPNWFDSPPLSCEPGLGFPSTSLLLSGSVFGLFAYYSFKREHRSLAYSSLCALAVFAYCKLFLGANWYYQVVMGYVLAGLVVPVVLLLHLAKGGNVYRTMVGSHVFAGVVLGLCVLIYNATDLKEYYSYPEEFVTVRGR